MNFYSYDYGDSNPFISVGNKILSQMKSTQNSSTESGSGSTNVNVSVDLKDVTSAINEQKTALVKAIEGISIEALQGDDGTYSNP